MIESLTPSNAVFEDGAALAVTVSDESATKDDEDVTLHYAGLPVPKPL